MLSSLLPVRRLLRDPGRHLLARKLWEHRWLTFLTLATTGLTAALEGIGIGLLVPFLDNLLNTGNPPFQTGWAWFDRAVLAVDGPSLDRLYRISGLLLVVMWVRVGVGYLSRVLSIRLQESILDRLRRQVIDQIQAVALSFFSTAKTGKILNTITTEIKRLRVLFGIALQMVVQVSMLITYGIAVIWLSWQLSLVAIVLSGGLLLMLVRHLRNLRGQGRDIAAVNGKVTTVANEILGGIRTILEFGTHRFEAQRFAAVSREARNTITRAETLSAIVHPVTMGVSFTILLGIIIVAVQFFISTGALSVAAFLAFMFVMVRALPILQSINSLRAQWSVFRGALDDVVDLLRDDDKPYLPDGTRTLDRFQSAIDVQNLTFGYEPRTKVLKDVSLTIRRGQTLAIVGGSGAGKSTLADLIARLYDPDEGRTLLDGIDLREYRIESLRSHMAIVNQTTYLFNTSVRENIAYGLDGVTDERIHQVAAEANALEFIEAMPDGFDTLLGERGARLSGGQRQRIAIARALLRDPDILILDEATSALDSQSEKLVQESLERLMRNRTVIVIAHRLSTIENADRVVVLEDGIVVEQGTYAELLDQEGQLWKYHSLQFQAA
jgi:subfamily B ATP-binding cassette protein MsbA